MVRKRQVQVYVISDATGITAERVARAVLAQFSKQVKPVIQRFAHVKTTSQLEHILARAREERGVVLYSLVAAGLRTWMQGQKRWRQIELVDLLGPLLTRLGRHFEATPSLLPGLISVVGERSMDLAASIDFTLAHDDGHGLNTLGQADLIILGASRTTKTPTSLYLSCNYNLKVANVPLILGMDPPGKVFSLKRPKKVGFTISPEKLTQIRRSRYGGHRVEGYNDPRAIRDELAFSHEVFDMIKGIQIIDVTNRPIEAVANRIIDRQKLI
jgi:[pyruvate, water dikinase]-phosphate phosphotransferase / [pyruvate, water dikinase] kinase